ICQGNFSTVSHNKDGEFYCISLSQQLETIHEISQLPQLFPSCAFTMISNKFHHNPNDPPPLLPSLGISLEQTSPNHDYLPTPKTSQPRIL
ncbi:hypothetical protein COCVIDRAFT_85735, partial [Bipolaris victoriae FI3]